MSKNVALDEPHVYIDTPFYRDKDSLSSRLETHLLGLLEDDIVQFAAGTHTESDKASDLTNIQEVACYIQKDKIFQMMLLKGLYQNSYFGISLEEESGKKKRKR